MQILQIRAIYNIAEQFFLSIFSSPYQPFIEFTKIVRMYVMFACKTSDTKFFCSNRLWCVITTFSLTKASCSNSYGEESALVVVVFFNFIFQNLKPMQNHSKSVVTVGKVFLVTSTDSIMCAISWQLSPATAIF